MGWISWSILFFFSFRGLQRSVEHRPPHEQRRRILALLRSSPGLSMAQIRKRLNARRGTVEYHVYVLERVGEISGVRSGREHRYFAARKPPPNFHQIMLLQGGRVYDVVELIFRFPGIIQKEITASTGLSRKVFRKYVEELKQQGLVIERRNTRTRAYYPTTELGNLVSAVGIVDRSTENR